MASKLSNDSSPTTQTHMPYNTPYSQYRNTPDPATKLSSAQCVFGRPIKDFIPIRVLPGHYIPQPTWSDTEAAREEALRDRHMKEAERWTVHARRLPPLAVGHHVCIQNQTCPHPNKWDKTDIVIEVRQFDQYVVVSMDLVESPFATTSS